MVMVPREEVHRLEGFTLPDEQHYDVYHQAQRLLLEHKRSEAVAAIETLPPKHFLAHWAKLSIGQYDANPSVGLGELEDLANLFPKDEYLRIQHIALLRRLGRRQDLIAKLEELASQPTTDPVFTEWLAEALNDDARQYRTCQAAASNADAKKTDGREPVLHHWFDTVA